MEHISEETIEKARQIDLLSYLKLHDPGSLVRVGHDTYCTREHDSLRIDYGKWFWFSRRIGGYSALDYLIYVKGYKFVDAVKEVLESGATPTPYIPALVKKKLILPERNNSTYKVERYLKSRGIHPKVIWHCIRSNLLYESRKYHNAVFVGYNKQHEPKYAALRSTFASFKGEASGSDKTYSFRVEGYSNASKLHVFEAAIDLLSLASIKELRGENWLNDHYLSLGGISQSSVRNGLPKGLDNYLMHHSDIETICLHLDNDEPGRNAAAAMIKILSESYTVLDEPPPYGKDMNDYLMAIRQMDREKEELER